MSFADIQFAIAPEVLALGVSGIAFAANNLRNRSADDVPGELKSLLARATEEALQSWNPGRLQSDPILADFRRLHVAVGATNPKDLASPESLLRYLFRKRALPRINLLVDLYNMICVQTQLSLGAHDLAHVQGNIALRLAEGTEHFRPLGSDKSAAVAKGEYCYIDDANDVLCRLEVRQCDKTKLAPGSQHCFFMIQGNRATPAEYLQKAADNLISLIHRFCGGEVRMLWRP